MVKNKYYYLISGFPDIQPEDTKAPFTTDEFRSHLSNHLHPDDYELLSFLFLPVDHDNLLKLLNKEDTSNLSPGKYSIEFLQEQIKEPLQLPDYLQIFIEHYQNEEEIFPDLNWKDQLTRLYYDYLNEVIQNDFLLQWFHFEQIVSNIEVAYAAKRHEIDISQAVIGDQNMIETLKKSNLKSDSYIREIPYIDKIIRLCEADNLKERETGIDRVKWDFLNDTTTFHYFTIENVLAYMLKIMMLNRWIQLNPERGKEKIEKLIEDLQSGYDIPAEYVV
ncbi:MAG: DUF2764 domain-containing protein [Bacteroidales bacterium]|nr:DUF2764 domain-containing protein [Bacteroidales bacterium]MCF8327903.1 DUF2764 domain-containing protein [Bacteroidales bacterium]